MIIEFKPKHFSSERATDSNLHIFPIGEEHFLNEFCPCAKVIIHSDEMMDYRNIIVHGTIIKPTSEI